MKTRSEILQEYFEQSDVAKKLVYAHFQNAYKDQGMSQSQIHLFMLIAHQGPISLKELATELHITPGAVTQIVDAVEQTGYIQRTPGTKDRRVTYLTLTEAGKEKLTDFKKIREDIFVKATTHLRDEEIAQLVVLQGKMMAYFREQNEQNKQHKDKETK